MQFWNIHESHIQFKAMELSICDTITSPVWHTISVAYRLFILWKVNHSAWRVKCGACIRDQLFSIVPVTVTWNSNGMFCMRTQIPLTLSFAVSIHKCQGLTVDKAVIDLGHKEFAADLAYVGLSGAKKLSDVMFDPVYLFSRFTAASNSSTYKPKQQFL